MFADWGDARSDCNQGMMTCLPAWASVKIIALCTRYFISKLSVPEVVRNPLMLWQRSSPVREAGQRGGRVFWKNSFLTVFSL
jgi:hypothetical protein